MSDRYEQASLDLSDIQSSLSDFDSMSGASSISNATPIDTGGLSLFQFNEKRRLCQEVRELVLDLKRTENDPNNAHPLLKHLSTLYYENYHFRENIGDVLSECGYATTTYTMLKNVQSKGFFKWTNPKLWKTTHDLLDNAWNYSNDSAQLAHDFAKSSLLELMCVNLHRFPDVNPKPKTEQFFIIQSTLSIMNNLARRPENKEEFKKDSCFKILLRFTSSTVNFIKVVTLITLAYIADPKEAHNLTQDYIAIQTIIHWMNISIDVDPKKPMKEGFTAGELALALAKLSIDGNTEKILDGKALTAFERMLDRPELEQKIGAAKCIGMLAFNDSAAKAIKKNKNIIKSLKRIKELETDDELLEAVEGALWELFDSKSNTKKAASNADPSKPQHVFISYHKHDFKTVKQIWHRMRREGYEVWIDKEKMRGDILQAMATAVEGSSRVVLCVSENYKQDQRCRTVANYAFEKEKGFIPLKMQKPYNPNGWLGLIISSTTVYDFGGEEDFEENMDRFISDLKHQVKPNTESPNALPDITRLVQQVVTKVSPPLPRLDIREPSVPIQTLPSPSYMSSNIDITADSKQRGDVPPSVVTSKEKIGIMTKRHVEEWLTRNDLESVVQNFQDMDGKMLWQLKDTKSKALDLYLQMLREHDLSSQQCLKFGAVLDELE